MTDGMDEAAQGPSYEDIESALNKTGFLLEHRVAKLLRDYRGASEATLEITVGDAYPDPESGKSREIDIYADVHEFINRDPEISIQVSVTLIIECKNSSGPFVLIGDHEVESPSRHDFALISFDPFSPGFAGAKYSSLEYRLQLSHIPGLPTRDDFTGRQLLRMNRQGGAWKADNNAVFDSILYPLAKARQYKVKYHKQQDEEHPLEVWQIPTIRYIFPIVVTSGQLYTVDATDDNLQISQAGWASIRRTFSSNDLRGSFWADVVSFASWIDYLDARVARVFSNVKDAVTKNIHFYDPEWMISHFGQPENQEFFQEWLDYHFAERRRAAERRNPPKGG